jgi:hypothetical protein
LVLTGVSASEERVDWDLREGDVVGADLSAIVDQILDMQ